MTRTEEYTIRVSRMYHTLVARNWTVGELQNWRVGDLETWRLGELDRVGELETGGFVIHQLSNLFLALRKEFLQPLLDGLLRFLERTVDDRAFRHIGDVDADVRA